MEYKLKPPFIPETKKLDLSNNNRYKYLDKLNNVRKKKFKNYQKTIKTEPFNFSYFKLNKKFREKFPLLNFLLLKIRMKSTILIGPRNFDLFILY